MKAFTKKLITPVIAAIVLVSSAAFAQDAVLDVIVENDGEWQNAGLFHWRYDAATGSVEWGPEECAEESTTTTTEGDLSIEAMDTNEKCRSTVVAEGEAEEGEEPDGPSHGDVVSSFVHDTKDLTEEQLDELGVKNRGQLIREIAKWDLFKGDDESDGTDVDDPDDGDELDDEPKPEKPEKGDNPGKAKGKNK